jgi:inhibitor of KinA
MIVEPLGESAYILRNLGAPAFRVAEALEAARLPGMIEAVASYDTVGIYVDPEVFNPSRLPSTFDLADAPPTLHRIPVCYELGEDLAEVATALKMEPKDVVELHAGREYDCYAVGFCPGFPYLGYLPPPLDSIGRMASPRTRVEPGSVAIAAGQTGIYPLPRPGGWAILGRTPLTLVDVDDDYFPISAGDRVLFTPITRGEYDRRLGERL